MERPAPVEALFTTTSHAIRALVARAIPEGVSIGFDLTGPGGGTWTVLGHGRDVDVVSDLAEPVDCLLRCRAADFGAILDGELDARRAFLDGRLRIEGDVGLVHRLNKMLARARPEIGGARSSLIDRT